MTDIEKKALEQAVAAAGRRMQDYALMDEENVLRQSIVAHARAIEQHEAYKQEVSDAVTGFDEYGTEAAWEKLSRFIIAKPDPLVEEFGHENAEQIRAAIEKRGGKIVWGEG